MVCGALIPHGRLVSPYCYACSIKVNTVTAKAGREVRKAIQAGRLQKPTEGLICADCGKPAKDYDHRRYLKPLDVVPVCRSCNLKRGPALDVVAAVQERASA
jgi:hypothetical protein